MIVDEQMVSAYLHFAYTVKFPHWPLLGRRFTYNVETTLGICGFDCTLLSLKAIDADSAVAILALDSKVDGFYHLEMAHVRYHLSGSLPGLKPEITNWLVEEENADSILETLLSIY